MNVATIAEACHEMNRCWCDINGDLSQPQWIDAPDWQRESAVAGVEYRLAHPNAGPEYMHQSWFDQKVIDGWRYGPVKDPVAKTHPCMVPFRDLPPAQQFKDRLFSLVVDALKGDLP
jgi:hypothetical protein